MTKDELEYVIKNIHWYDISIQQDITGSWILILMCDNNEQSEMLAKAINDSGGIDLRGFAKTDDDLYGFRIDFKKFDKYITCRTTRTLNSYEPLKKFESGEIVLELITGGVLIGTLESGEGIYHYSKMMKLTDLINLN